MKQPSLFTFQPGAAPVTDALPLPCVECPLNKPAPEKYAERGLTHCELDPVWTFRTPASRCDHGRVRDAPADS